MLPEAWCEIHDRYDECSDSNRDHCRTCSGESTTDQHSSDLSFRDLSSGIDVDCSQLDDTIPFKPLNVKYGSNSRLNVKNTSNSRLLVRTPSIGVSYDNDATGKCFCDPVSSKSSSGSVKCCSNSACGPDSGKCGCVSPTASLTSEVLNGSDISWIDEEYDASNNLMAMDLNILADCSEELVLDETCATEAVLHLHALLSLNFVEIHCFAKNRVLKPLRTILERTTSSDLKLAIAKLMVRVWEDTSYWGRITISSKISDQVILKTCNGTENKELEKIACQLQEEYNKL